MGRTEPRDLYDVYWLFEQGEMDLFFVPANFASKCKHKGQDPEQLSEALKRKERALSFCGLLVWQYKCKICNL